MARVIAVCRCGKEDDFTKCLVSDYYCCESCHTIAHYTELNYKIEGENNINTKGVIFNMFGHVTRDGEYAGYPFIKD